MAKIVKLEEELKQISERYHDVANELAETKRKFEHISTMTNQMQQNMMTILNVKTKEEIANMTLFEKLDKFADYFSENPELLKKNAATFKRSRTLQSSSEEELK